MAFGLPVRLHNRKVGDAPLKRLSGGFESFGHGQVGVEDVGDLVDRGLAEMALASPPSTDS